MQVGQVEEKQKLYLNKTTAWNFLPMLSVEEKQKLYLNGIHLTIVGVAKR